MRKKPERTLRKKDSLIEPEIEIEKETYIGVFSGATMRILQLQLDFLNLQIAEVNSLEFKTMRLSILPKGYLEDPEMLDIYRDWNNKYYSATGDNTYAFLPIDWRIPVKREVYFQIQDYLLLMFPSNFRLYGLVGYTEDDETKKFTESFYIPYQEIALYTTRNKPLHIHSSKVKESNDFLKYCFTRIPILKEFNVSFDAYFDSFKQRDFKMSYLNLCIAVEALSPDQNEISFQISRLCAVLNSNTKEEGETIFKNMKKFYSIRSQIVHGSKPDYESLKLFYEYFQALVSCSLVEITHLITEDRESLKTMVDSTGYGERGSFNLKNPRIDFNPFTRDDISFGADTIKKVLGNQSTK